MAEVEEGMELDLLIWKRVTMIDDGRGETAIEPVVLNAGILAKQEHVA